MVWLALVLPVAGVLVLAWLLDRSGPGHGAAGRIRRQANDDLARGDQYRFLRKGG